MFLCKRYWYRICLERCGVCFGPPFCGFFIFVSQRILLYLNSILSSSGTSHAFRLFSSSFSLRSVFLLAVVSGASTALSTAPDFLGVECWALSFPQAPSGCPCLWVFFVRFACDDPLRERDAVSGSVRLHLWSTALGPLCFFFFFNSLYGSLQHVSPF